MSRVPQESALEVIISSMLFELSLVFQAAIPICIAIAVVSVAKNTILGILYWPLKLIAIIKICLVKEEESRESTSRREFFHMLARCLTDWTIYICLSTLSRMLLESYTKLKIREKRQYGSMYNFILNFIWALETDFLVRATFLLAVLVHQAIASNKKQRRMSKEGR